MIIFLKKTKVIVASCTDNLKSTTREVTIVHLKPTGQWVFPFLNIRTFLIKNSDNTYLIQKNDGYLGASATGQVVTVQSPNVKWNLITVKDGQLIGLAGTEQYIGLKPNTTSLILVDKQRAVPWLIGDVTTIED